MKKFVKAEEESEKNIKINFDKELENTEKKFKNLEKKIIFPFFREKFGSFQSAFLLYQGIDQYVRIYAYLIDFKYVIEFDVSDLNKSIVENETITVEDYKKSLIGKGRIKKENREYLDKILSKNKID